jgi:hypothetical protein
VVGACTELALFLGSLLSAIKRKVSLFFHVCRRALLEQHIHLLFHLPAHMTHLALIFYKHIIKRI